MKKLGWILGAITLAACSNPPANTSDGGPDSSTGHDSSMVTDATTDATPPDASMDAVSADSFNAVCDQFVAYGRMCGRTQCQQDDDRMACGLLSTYYSPSVLSVIANCLATNPGCEDAGNSASACFQGMIDALDPDTAQTNAALALCTGCPALNGSITATPAECAAAMFQRNDAGQINVLGQLLILLNDATVQQVGACGGAQPDAGGSDGGAFANCGAIGRCVSQAIPTTTSTCVVDASSPNG